MLKLMRLLTIVCLFFGLGTMTYAASPNPVSSAYMQSYFTTIAAASCLGVYLPHTSQEFDYLRSYGWQIESQQGNDGKVELNYAVAKNYFPQVNKQIYLVTFRGSASKSDWKINLATKKVNYGGSTLREMQELAAQPVPKDGAAVHAGFNSYVDAVLRSGVVDENGKLRGLFKRVSEDPDAYLVLTGHSLGGAAATLLGERLASLGMPKEKFVVITFGAPAVGNSVFAEQYGNKIKLVRISNTADPVPGSLQTFFGGYKQFGEPVKYSLSNKISNLQHAMAMYFDYSISEYYKERDREISMGRLEPVTDRKITQQPVVAVWVNTSDSLKKLAYVTDIKRFVLDEYRKMLPSYIIMERNLPKDAYTTQDLLKLSREAGAEYMLVCGMDGSQAPKEGYWYLTLEQVLVDKNGRMLTLGGFGRKVSPAVGNIQAAGENLWQAREALCEHLPFIVTQHEANLGY